MDRETEMIVAGLPLAAALIRADDRLHLMNPPALALFGSAGEGRHYALTFRQPELLAAIATARQAGAPARARVSTPGAQETVLDVAVTPLEKGLMLVFQDLSALAQMDQMRRDFVANVSHELRTPLTSLLGFIETLQGPAKEDPVARARFLAIMAAEAQRMERLVRDLLHLSRVEAEERRRPDTVLDLAVLAKEAIANLRPLAEAAQVTLVLNGAGQAQLLPADRDQMMQVLTNLIENAVKYGSSAGSTVQVDLSRTDSPRGPFLLLAVTDHGEGIAAHHLPRLTERFYRVDSHRSREKGGTGLGLAIVKHIVARHRGRLTIESEPGKGSKFNILLPLHDG